MQSSAMKETRIRPATEQDLIIQNDDHKLHPRSDGAPYTLHDVLVDGHRGKAGVGSLGLWSERILLVFDPPHEKYGEEWMTKYFMFDEEDPGLVRWGHNGESFRLDLIVD